MLEEAELQQLKEVNVLNCPLLPQSSVQKWGAQFQELMVFPQANIQTSARSYLYFREIQVPSCGGHWVAQENNDRNPLIDGQKMCRLCSAKYTL